MEPETSQNYELKLPAPVAGSGQQEQLPAQPEIVSGAPEQAPVSSSAGPVAMPTMTMPTMPTQTVSLPQSGVAQTTSTSTPMVAEDNDLIEKEWVNKAKQIVERTKEDPHQQNKELTVFKADYLQKRYNKTIKLSE
ncbi:MAG TPA: hypothetical protein VHB51_00505 [Candidatus Saccharimonadales bacterium]|nr:hypothetical protein [Candidatus Saccharimonadales bacterium]